MSLLLVLVIAANRCRRLTIHDQVQCTIWHVTRQNCVLLSLYDTEHSVIAVAHILLADAHIQLHTTVTASSIVTVMLL